MENIREFERETQLLLQKKMGLEVGDDDEDGKFNSIHPNYSTIVIMKEETAMNRQFLLR